MNRQRMLALRTCRNGIWTVYPLVGWVHRHENGQTNTWDILKGIHKERHVGSRNWNRQCAQYWSGVILNELGHVGSQDQKRGWNDGAKMKGIPTWLSISWLATAEEWVRINNVFNLAFDFVICIGLSYLKKWSTFSRRSTLQSFKPSYVCPRLHISVMVLF